ALTENEHGHLVGDRLMMADVQLLEVLLAMNDLQPESFASYPKSKKMP
uniref:Glutathione S-transferase C-terminal domain-containing protein n=1 Tax=Plectus sambesii TaxID=2011161 RepID=A0A914W9C7_9BILA